MSNPDPTARQKELLVVISKFAEQNGYPPSLREMADILGLASTNAVHDLLVLLEKKGLVTVIKKVSRGLRITEAGKAYLNG